MSIRLGFAVLIILFFGAFTQPFNNVDGLKLLPPFYEVEQQWVEEKLNSLSLEEKIAQLMMVAAYSNKDQAHVNEIKHLVQKHKIGGLMFLQGGPVRQAKLTNYYQSLAETPLLIAIDAEWGLGMRLDSTFNYPWAITLGAIQEDTLIYQMGRQIGNELKAIGVHMNFAPVADINSNPNNPIINARSFGENKNNVAEKSLAYMHGLQNVNILACAKHFPGHGDTDSDSHKTLPQLKQDKAQLDSIEIYPFKQLINEGLASVMTAHLEIPSLEPRENRAVTLSDKVVQGLLKEELRFKGLAITDALNMKGVSNYYKPGELELEALLAGNDILLFAEDVPKAIALIKRAVNQNKISEQEIDSRVRKVLMAKKWVGLDKFEPIDLSSIKDKLNQKEQSLLAKKMLGKSLSLVKNDEKLIPFKRLDTLEIAYVELGTAGGDEFFHYLNKYLPVKRISQKSYGSKKEFDRAIAFANCVIVGYHTDHRSPWKSYKVNALDQEILKYLENIPQDWLFVQFSNPYAAIDQEALLNSKAHLLAYQNNEEAQELAAQALFGAISIEGKAPVSAKPIFFEGQGVRTYSLGRLGYAQPEEFNIPSNAFNIIDSIIQDAIDKEATPGAQVLVAYKGSVIFQKAYGHHTYNGLKQVEENHIYDLASITKISATLPCVIELASDGKLALTDNLGKLNSKLRGTNKYNLSLKEVLAHNSGLPAWIPFYKATVDKGKLRDTLYSTVKDVEYPYEVAGAMYMKKEFVDSIFNQVYTVPLGPKKYRYSDLGYFLISEGLNEKLNPGFEQYVKERFYDKLGAYTMGYHPRQRYFLEQIVPTEYDTYFRNQLIHGYVHDPGAAMLGGVGGHAGLFSSANDLAKLAQMYLQQGYYGGEQFFDPVVFNAFTQYQYPGTDNRRGAGFDKPVQRGKGGPACEYASPISFGHSGFTGTLLWVDPAYDLVYIFLSNRVYPRGDNYKLISMDVRTKVQEVVYESIINSNNSKPKL